MLAKIAFFRFSARPFVSAHHPQPQGLPPDPKRSRRSSERDYFRYSSMGLEFTLTMGLFALLGWFLDRKLGLAFPVFLLAGVFLGMGLGIYRMKLRVDAMTPPRKPPPGEREEDHPSDPQPPGRA